MVKQLSSVVLSACMLLTMSACAPLGQGIKSFDQSKIVLMQTEQMVAGEDIAVVETSQGDFKMRFFPSEAPKTVENFIQLAKSGYFDGQKISYIERQQEESGKCRLFAGSGKPLTEPGESIYDEPLEQEISYNLGTITGAVVAYAPEGTVDSRFYISGTHPVSREEIEQLTASNYPSQLVELFEDYGGYPDEWLHRTVFAQVVEGMDVVDAIISGAPDSDPDAVTEVEIFCVTIQKYGQQQEDSEQARAKQTDSQPVEQLILFGQPHQ